MRLSPLLVRLLCCLGVASTVACRSDPKGDVDTAGLSGGTDTEDGDGDGFTGADDCDDANASVYAGAEELCNGIDDNCDGQVDEGVLSVFWSDVDGDGFGDPSTSVELCAAEAGLVTNDTDCDDGNADVFPGAEELCNGIDDDCDVEVDEDGLSVWYEDTDDDGFGDPSTAFEGCEPGIGAVADGTDCDDADPAVYPGADEVCNEQDDDCDTEVDEGVTSVFYVDLDGDGWGDPAATTDGCTVPEGYAADPGDCDDGNDAVNPDATEVCNSVDDDCDGDVDDDDSSLDTATASVWYADADSDGYGDGLSTVTTCLTPSDYVANTDDCDDTDSAVNPGATEVCNSVDDDCDGDIDDDDGSLDLSSASTWFADGDGDGYGDASTSSLACDAPSTHVSDGTDCDDADAAVNPGATEVCNSVDDDCDGAIDDDDSSLDTSTGTTWYADSDGDGYGDAASTVTTCEAPSGYLSDDSDCDDSSAWTSPGSAEVWDGEDNDCDGDVDDDLYKGTGADGSLSVTGDTDLSTDASGSRVDADAVAFTVSAISGDTITLDSTASGLAAGDEVVLINLQGSDTAHAAVGTYEFASVDSVSGADVTLLQAVAEVYGESSNTDLTDQVIVLQRVPHYTDVTVAAAGTLTTSAWDGTTGGLLAFRASGTVSIASGGIVAADSGGYTGGATGTSDNCDAYQGESYAGLGEGDGDGACTAYNEAYGHWANNFGGGGAHITGAGGEHAGGATDGDSWTGGSATPPYAGDTYGDADLATLFFGSGGGGVWNGGTDGAGENPGPGGSGGGIVIIGADTLTASAAESITSFGGTTHYWAWGTWTYGAGGGAGGSIWLQAETLTLGTGAVDASGGFGESTHIRVGGDGGEGRVRIDCVTCNGSAHGTTTAESALDDASTPDPGHSVSPS